ncbi:MAG TPA: type I phosphomannose isomerase catalytic subunit [Candidatus Bathyarchaeia archaeon]|nr:type I phosphomannose isomerase catalytic subunit [Candidatus Bathyarchaeia archaeon]
MNRMNPGLLRFHDTFEKRIWGGQKLRTLFNKDIARARVAEPIGEDWLISDHLSAESAVSEGTLAGLTLRSLIERDARAVLGQLPQLTPRGRFPLLLKLIDAADVLSVQVHPDDDCARRLGEPDIGKTEMWHVLHADKGSELICGLQPEVTPKKLRESVEDGTVERLMPHYAAVEGLSLLVPAGAVHAIGAGVMLAEIQQNSDLTYRLYDWNRVDDDGKPRPLHLDKAFNAIHFGANPPCPVQPLTYDCTGARCSVLAACPYFAAELIELNGRFRRNTDGRSFHILLVKTGAIQLSAGGDETTLNSGQAALVCGASPQFELSGTGAVLDYYVPDIATDIIGRLQTAGHALENIKSLGGGTF